MSSVRKSRPALAGFTLVELAIVVLILGILAAVGAPKFTESLMRARIDSAAKRVAADIRYAQSVARSKSTNQVISFAVGTDGYSLTAVSDLNHAEANYDVNLSGQTPGVTIQSADFGGTTNLTYTHYGQPVEGGTVVLQSSTHQATITVTPTGRVEITF